MTSSTALMDGSEREVVAYLRTQSLEDAFPPVPFVVTTWERHLGTHVGDGCGRCRTSSTGRSAEKVSPDSPSRRRRESADSGSCSAR